MLCKASRTGEVMVKNTRLSKVLGAIGLALFILLVLIPMVLLGGHLGKRMDDYAEKHVVPRPMKDCMPMAGIVDGCYNK